MGRSSYNLTPNVPVECDSGSFFKGWTRIFNEIRARKLRQGPGATRIVMECYPGVYYQDLLDKFAENLAPDHLFLSNKAMKSEEDIYSMTFPDITDDRIFGYMTRLNLHDFFELEKVNKIREQISILKEGIIFIFGHGATLLADNPDILIYADMARWEIQERMKRNEVGNLGLNTHMNPFEQKYKRGFFVDWRICDRHKKSIWRKVDYFLDTNCHENPGMLTSDGYFSSLQQALNMPFSVVPYFDPGPWGGQWLKKKMNLNQKSENYAWCFNCVPEENSLLLKIGDHDFETPAINLVFSHPEELLGKAVHARFGDEFPIRFDFLDTMGGGNLSLQVHPTTEYIQQNFGMHYTQDESYYLMEAGESGTVFLGLMEDVVQSGFESEVRSAESEGKSFEPEDHVERWPAKKHDHFLIPAGTIHCSGKNTMVLEISSTPYIFTFKLWDWGRNGMDGKPRPINVNHGLRVIDWTRTSKWTKNNLINQIVRIDEGNGWIEERTGLHEREFI